MKSLKVLARKARKAEVKFSNALSEIESELQSRFPTRTDLSVTYLEGDGIAVMFEDEGNTGIGIEEFIEMMKSPDFDIHNVITSL